MAPGLLLPEETQLSIQVRQRTKKQAVDLHCEGSGQERLQSPERSSSTLALPTGTRDDGEAPPHLRRVHTGSQEGLGRAVGQ